MFEFIFLFSAFQCGSDAPQATFSVTNEQVLVGQRGTVHNQTVEAFLSGLEIHNVENGGCTISNPLYLNLGANDEIPSLTGAHNQQGLDSLAASIQEYSYLRLALFELGTSNQESSVYDLQDVVLLINEDSQNKTCTHSFFDGELQVDCVDRLPAD